MRSDPKFAELEFREAFERLKAGEPVLLPKGSRVTQNNVARERGCDPSALRRDRYPELIKDIQDFLRSGKRSQSKQSRSKQRTAAERLDKRLELLKDLELDASRYVSVLAENLRLRTEVDSLRARLMKAETNAPRKR